MINKSPVMGLFPFQIRTSCLIHGGDPNCLLNGMILQVGPDHKASYVWEGVGWLDIRYPKNPDPSYGNTRPS